MSPAWSRAPAFPTIAASNGALGLVPRIEAGGTRDFTLDYRLLATAAEVRQALEQVEGIRHGRPTQVREAPLAREP